MVKLFKRQKTSFEHEHVRLSFFYSFLELNQKFVFTLFFVFRLKSGNLRLLAGACDVSTVHRSSAFWKRETTRFVELWQLFECSSIQRLGGVDRMERMRVEKEVSGVSRILVVWRTWSSCLKCLLSDVSPPRGPPPRQLRGESINDLLKKISELSLSSEASKEPMKRERDKKKWALLL